MKRKAERERQRERYAEDLNIVKNKLKAAVSTSRERRVLKTIIAAVLMAPNSCYSKKENGMDRKSTVLETLAEIACLTATLIVGWIAWVIL